LDATEIDTGRLNYDRESKQSIFQSLNAVALKSIAAYVVGRGEALVKNSHKSKSEVIKL